MRQDTQGQQRGQQAERRRLQDQQFQSLSTSDMFNYHSSQKNIESSEYQQSVDLVKKFTHFKVKDNNISNECGN